MHVLLSKTYFVPYVTKSFILASGKCNGIQREGKTPIFKISTWQQSHLLRHSTVIGNVHLASSSQSSHFLPQLAFSSSVSLWRPNGLQPHGPFHIILPDFTSFLLTEALLSITSSYTPSSFNFFAISLQAIYYPRYPIWTVFLFLLFSVLF